MASSQVCRTCGTRLEQDAIRCVVCGAEVSPGSSSPTSRQTRKITLDFPVALAVLVGVSLLSAGVAFAATRLLGEAAGPAVASETPTLTPTLTLTPTASFTPTIISSPTERPPQEYIVAVGDTCGGIAFFFDVSVRSIVEFNNLGTACILSIGQKLLVPYPTPTVTPLPTSTLSPAEATEAACEKLNYTVEADDTLFGIAQNYNVSMQGIKDYNGLTTDNVFEGQLLIIPLCERLSAGGATPTATQPAPYPAPNLLLPRDGEPFTLANDTVSLQWAAVAALREDEFYRVTVEDITEGTVGSGEKLLIDYVTDTKYIIATDFRPPGSTPHIFRWWIEPVRLVGSTATGEPRYISAGAASIRRAFSWSGAAVPATSEP
jgi:LysM repeat protein